jgi:predicted P-loop ATPase
MRTAGHREIHAVRPDGLQWFSDSIKTFEGKEAAELLQGVWIVDMGELEANSKTDVRAVKSFLSKGDDQYARLCTKN